MEEKDALAFLRSLLNKTLRVHATDGRIFVGPFKCTDNESNIILDKAYEYRPPSAKAVAAAAEAASSSSRATVRANMTSRFVGLIVVPGEHIVKIEVEEEDDGIADATVGSTSNEGIHDGSARSDTT